MKNLRNTIKKICSVSDLRILKITSVFLLVLFVSILTAGNVSAQNKQDKVITLKESGITLENLFKKIEQKSNYRFLYRSAGYMDLSKKVNVDVQNKKINELLDIVLVNSGLKYTLAGINLIVIAPFAQQKSTITGKVTDKSGEPLIGVTVSVNGTKKGTVTNANGIYSIDVETSENNLVFSFLGMERKEVAINDHKVINMVMSEDVALLKEVHVISTGYQTIKKEKNTGAITTISSEDLDKRNSINIMDNVEGKIPGLVQFRGVTTIRGVSTMKANQNVLVVVDGLPIEGSVSDINPYDIENVNVLKDAAAAAIYGARASNGVIVITTKRAKEKGKTIVEFSANLTYNNKPDYSYYNYMTPTQQVNWENDYYKWWFGGAGGTVTDPITSFQTGLSQGGAITPVQYDNYLLKKGMINQTELNSRLEKYKKNDFAKDYKDHALLNQVIQQYNLALRTNSEKSQSNLVINYKTDNSGLINAFSKQINISFKGSYNVTKWFDFDYGINTVIGKKRSHNSTSATNPFNVPSYYSLFNADGSRSSYSTNRFNIYNTVTETTPKLFSTAFNHLDELENDYVNETNLNSRYNLNLNFKILPGLTINPMFQYEDNRYDSSGYSEADSYTMRWLQDVYTTRTGTEGSYVYTNLLPQGGRLITKQLKSPSYTARAQVNYNKEFKKHSISLIAGTEFRETKSYGTTGGLFGYDDQLQVQTTSNMDFAALYKITSTFFSPSYPVHLVDYTDISKIFGIDTETKHRYASAYSNATYTYDRKYNVFGSLRKDYADLFGGDKKYRGRPLWSVGAAWNITNENFMKGISFVNYLKLRGSYGLTGNIDATTTSVLTATTGVNNITMLPNATVTNPPNSQLRWEKTATTNIGLDFALFESRLNGSFDWYVRKGTDLFALKRLDPSEGFTSVVINNASMTNKGFELSLDYDMLRPAKNDGFSWNSSLVMSYNTNEITYVDEVTTNPLTLASGTGYKVGYPVRSIFSFQYAGLDNVGRSLWYKADGTTTTEQLKTSDISAIIYSGNRDPKLNISFTNEFKYKGLSLSIFAVYYGGHFQRARVTPRPIQSPSYAPLPSYVLNSWTPQNTNTDVPGCGQYYQMQLGGATQFAYSDLIVRRADFIKIRNIVLAYTLPENISSKIKSSGVKLRFQINNPKTLWTKANDVHIDPETGGLPTPTSYVFGININF